MHEVQPAEPMTDPPFADAAADRHYHHLVDKGFTPHSIEANSPFAGVRNEMWWDKDDQFSWPTAATLIAAMVFIVLLVKGVPW